MRGTRSLSFTLTTSSFLRSLRRGDNTSFSQGRVWCSGCRVWESGLMEWRGQGGGRGVRNQGLGIRVGV